MTAIADRTIRVVTLGTHGKQDIVIPEGVRILNDGETPKPTEMVLRIINQLDGDKRLVWDSTNFAEIQDAKRMFDDLISKGMVPYVIDEKGGVTPFVMEEFDALAEQVMMKDERYQPKKEIIMSPEMALAGG